VTLLSNKNGRWIDLVDTDGPWFPIIFSEKCDRCAGTGKPRCVEFCPNGVFTIEDGKAIVAYPAKCGGDCSTIHCSACAPLCHNKAISFPIGAGHDAKLMASEKKDLIRKTTCEACKKQYWTNRKDDICFDCEKNRSP